MFGYFILHLHTCKTNGNETFCPYLSAPTLTTLFITKCSIDHIHFVDLKVKLVSVCVCLERIYCPIRKVLMTPNTRACGVPIRKVSWHQVHVSVVNQSERFLDTKYTCLWCTNQKGFMTPNTRACGEPIRKVSWHQVHVPVVNQSERFHDNKYTCLW